MKISRNAVLRELTDFVQADCGVVVGIPGIGKTFILSELVIGLLEKEIPACLVHLDALTEGSDADIAALLGMKESNWLDQLAAITVPESVKGVLIFDAFDAVRDEALKKRVLRQIADAKKKLQQWSVIASVRTYDALKSPRLIELFPQQISPDNIHCRKYLIPYLNDEELQEFLSRHDKLNELYKIANKRLKQLFRVPFFLSLMNLILKNGPEEATKLSVIKSEIELLDMYWTKIVHRVEPIIITEAFLKGLTERMVKDKQLSVDKYDYLSGLDSNRALVADQLLSENVLAQQGVQAVKIGYAHNILFDYAVSKLIIKDTAADISNFIQEDTSRALFLRPSFIYFFTRLWYSQRDFFWKIYQELSLIDDNTIRMFNKLVPSAIFVMEFEQADDLPLNENTAHGNSRIRDVLQGSLYLGVKADKLQRARILEKLSAVLQPQFVGEFAMVLHRFINTVDGTNEADILKVCGTASRNLYDYSTSQDVNWEQLIAYHAIPMVAITYASDIAQSKQRIEQVLDVMEMPDFNVARISVLLDKLQHIYLTDPDLVQDIYLRVFNQGELEDKPTTIHASVIMNFTMSRRDDFNLCRFRLQEFFPTYLRAFPEKGISLSLELVQLFVRSKNKDGVNPSGFTFPVRFEINGAACAYTPDMSHFWSGYSTPKEFELLDQVFVYFDELAATTDNDEKIFKLVNLFLANAVTAISWKRFLIWSAKYPDKLHQQLFQILLQPAILYWSDTIQEAAGLLENVAPFYSTKQIAQIESVIHSLPTYVPTELSEDCRQRIVRLLSRIPSESLQLKQSREVFAHRAPVPNTPVVEFSSYSEPYTERMAMSEQGVDVTDPTNDRFITVQEELTGFCHTYLNGFPPPDNYKEALHKAIETFISLNATPQLPSGIVEAVMRTVASTCAIVLRSDCHAQTYGESRSTDYTSIGTILLACLSRHSEADLYAEHNYSPGSIYTATPKSEAANGLNYLWKLTGNERLLTTIEQISRDKNPIARFGVTKSIHLLRPVQNDVFWKIVLERLTNETDNFITGDLIITLDRRKIFEDEHERLLNALTLALPQIGTLHADNILLKNFLLVSLAFYRFTGNETAKELLQKALYDHLNIAPTFVFTSFEIIQPANRYRRFDDEADIALSQRLVDVLMLLADKCRESIGLLEPDKPIPKESEEAIKILNEIIRRIYYSLQVNERVFNRPSSSTPLITNDEKIRFYAFIKPLLERIFDIADKARFMEPTTAYFYIQILGDCVDIDPEFSLFTIKRINELVAGSNYMYDRNSVSETVKFTEKLLADHRDLLNDSKAFAAIIDLLNMYAQSGWTEALELLQRMDEIFR